MFKNSLLARFTAACVLCIAANLPGTAMATGKTDSLWVKVQGQWDTEGRLVIEKLKKREPGERYVLEGRVELRDGAIHLAEYEIVPLSETTYSFINGDPAVREDINADTRIKAYGHFEKQRFVAVKIKIFQFSKDDDIEVEGPLVHVAGQKDGQGLYQIGSITTILQKNSQSVVASRKNVAAPFPVGIYAKLKVTNFAHSVPDSQIAAGSGNLLYAVAQTTLISRFSTAFKFYGRFELRRKSRSGLDQPGLPTAETDFRVRSLYVAWKPLQGKTAMTVTGGRQRLRDKRSWLYDRYMDGITLDFRHRRLRLSLAATQGFSTLANNVDQPHFIGNALYHFSRALTAKVTYIKENDTRAGQNDPSWYAVQLTGKAARFEYWAQGALYQTQDGAIKRRGYGIDAGFNLQPLPQLQGLYLIYHYAYGSADDPGTSDRREYFRQPNLQLNYYRYGGRRWMFYYGALMNPELSNLLFNSLTLGYRMQRFYVQFTGRSYKQNVASKRVRGNSLGMAPSGQSPDLGTDFEINLNYYPADSIELYLFGEWFRPGTAFATDKTITGFGSGIKYYFSL